jgi:transcriptional regulator with XRE-family HTH domain
MDIKHAFGERVRELRTKLGISQEDLSFRAELHRTYISSIESGKRNVSLTNIEKIAGALGCDMVDLLTFSNKSHGRE